MWKFRLCQEQKSWGLFSNFDVLVIIISIGTGVLNSQYILYLCKTFMTNVFEEIHIHIVRLLYYIIYAEINTCISALCPSQMQSITLYIYIFITGLSNWLQIALYAVKYTHRQNTTKSHSHKHTPKQICTSQKNPIQNHI